MLITLDPLAVKTFYKYDSSDRQLFVYSFYKGGKRSIFLSLGMQEGFYDNFCDGCSFYNDSQDFYDYLLEHNIINSRCPGDFKRLLRYADSSDEIDIFLADWENLLNPQFYNRLLRGLEEWEENQCEGGLYILRENLCLRGFRSDDFINDTSLTLDFLPYCLVLQVNVDDLWKNKVFIYLYEEDQLNNESIELRPYRLLNVYDDGQICIDINNVIEQRTDSLLNFYKKENKTYIGELTSINAQDFHNFFFDSPFNLDIVPFPKDGLTAKELIEGITAYTESLEFQEDVEDPDRFITITAKETDSEAFTEVLRSLIKGESNV